LFFARFFIDVIPLRPTITGAEFFDAAGDIVN
jgi:hypothetical protein